VTTLKQYNSATSQWEVIVVGGPGQGVPPGGATSQVLTKTSGTDYATAWQTPSGGGGGVPTTRTITTTAPLRIDGAGAADLSADRTLAVNTFSTTTTAAGVVPGSNGGGTTNFLRADGSWAAPPAGGGIADGNKGDVTLGGSGTTMVINAGVVSNAKAAVMPASTFKGNNTGTSAAPVDMTPAVAKALLAITNTDVSGLGTAATMTGPAGTIVGTTDTQTLSNKAITVGINAQTGTTYTLVLTDASKMITMNNAAAITLSVPTDASVAFPVGTTIDVAQIGAGKVTVAAVTPGTTAVNGTPSLGFRAQYSAATLIKIAANSWLVVGDLA